MRSRRTRPSDPGSRGPFTQSDPLPEVYDWNRFGRHRLRAPGSVLVELPLDENGRALPWVASVWPDQRATGGWTRMLWVPNLDTGHGWWLPSELAAGDVIEFGADNEHRAARWCGILDSYEYDRWVTVQGPYLAPDAAHNDARSLLALERFLPAIESRAPSASGRCPRGRRRPRPHLRGR